MTKRFNDAPSKSAAAWIVCRVWAGIRVTSREVRSAVTGMVPHNRLGRQIILKLKVYAGAEHPHEAQNPQPVELA